MQAGLCRLENADTLEPPLSECAPGSGALAAQGALGSVGALSVPPLLDGAVPQLQLIVLTLVQGVGSMGYISLIVILVYYVFAVTAMIFFAQNDPWRFGSLHMAMLTLFQCATLDDWTDVM